MGKLQIMIETMLGSTAGFLANISTRNLSRQRRNTILTFIVIIVSMITFVLSVSVVSSASIEIIEHTSSNIGNGLTIYDFEDFIDNNYISSIEQRDDIAAVIPRIRLLGKLAFNDLVIKNSTNSQRSILLPFASDFTLENQLNNLSSVLKTGVLPQNDHDICVTEDIANDLTLSVGDSITLHAGTYTDDLSYNISGIINISLLESAVDFTGNWILPEDVTSENRDPLGGKQSGFISYRVMWNFLPRIKYQLIADGKFNQIVVQLTLEADLDNLIQWLLPIEVDESREVLLSIDNLRQLFKVSTNITIRGFTFMIFVLLICALIMFNTLLGAITSRMKDIEIWASVGANPSHIKFNFMFESIIFGAVGGVLGYIFSLVIAYGGAVLRFPTSLSPDKLEFNWLFLTVITAVIVCLLAAIYPSRKASTAVVPSLQRSWKPGLGEMLTKQFSFDEEEIPIAVEPRDFKEFADYILIKMDVPTFFKVKRRWPVKVERQKDGTIKHSFKLDVAVFSAEGTYALISIWAIETPGQKDETMKIYCQVNPYSSFGESSGWAQSNTNFNKACFDTLDMIRQLSLKWRVEGRKIIIQRD